MRNGTFNLKNVKLPVQFLHQDLNFKIFYENFDFSINKWVNFVSPAMQKLEQELNEVQFKGEVKCGQGMNCEEIRKVYKKVVQELKDQQKENRHLKETIIQLKNLLQFYHGHLQELKSKNEELNEQVLDL